MLKLDFKICNIRIQNCSSSLIYRAAPRKQLREYKNAFEFNAVCVETQNYM